MAQKIIYSIAKLMMMLLFAILQVQMLYVQVLKNCSIKYFYNKLNCIAHGSMYSNCTDGDVRLFGGATEYEGTVEICLNNAWGTISDNLWGYEEAQTVCNSLGFFAPGTCMYYI